MDNDVLIVLNAGEKLGMNWYKFNDTFYLIENNAITQQAPSIKLFPEHNAYVTPLITTAGCNLYLNGINITLQSPANTIKVFKDGVYIYARFSENKYLLAKVFEDQYGSATETVLLITDYIYNIGENVFISKINDISSIFLINGQETFTKVITNSPNDLVLKDSSVVDSVTGEVYYTIDGNEFKNIVEKYNT